MTWPRSSPVRSSTRCWATGAKPGSRGVCIVEPAAYWPVWRRWRHVIYSLAHRGGSDEPW